MPIQAVRWKIAERFGWTLEQVDALSLADLYELLEVIEGENKAKGIGVEVHDGKASR